MRNFFSMLVTGMLALAGAGLAHAQQAVPVRLVWGTYANLPTTNPDAPRRTPTFQGAYHGATDAIGTYTQRLPGTVRTIALDDAVYEPFPAADLRLLGNAALPAAPTVRLRPATDARQPVTFALLQPARRNPQTGQAERLVSFTLSYQAEDAASRGGGGTAARGHASSSVLSSGDWFKIGVPRSGVYKLDRATLQSLGLPVGTLDPRRVQLFGNAMGLLPQANAAPRPDDLAENNLYFKGNSDATFDADEYFLFYARGPHTWRASQPGLVNQPLSSKRGYLGEGGRFKHINNVYSDTAYYFVRVGAANGRRVAAAPTPAAAASRAPITTFLDRRFYEHDLMNLLHSGRSWVGESFTSTSGPREFSFSKEGYPALADLVPGDTLWVTAALAATSSQLSSFALALNGVPLGNQGINGVIACSEIPTAGANSFTTYRVALPANPSADPKVTLTYNPLDATGTGYLDYLELVVKRRLNFPGTYLEFNSLNNVWGAGTAGTFTLTNASGAQVWDVTDPRRPLSRTLDGSGSFVAPTDSLREYVAVLPTGPDFGVPRLFGKVANQNLHQLMSTSPDLVIVTHPVLKAAADKLAQHRRDYSGLTVAVVTTPQVYNEYSSGGQDVTAIRDMMKQVYDNNPSPTTRRTHLLLFGDASFDYKSSWQNDAAKQPAWWSQRAPFKSAADFNKANQNYVPTYESRESFLAVSCSRNNEEGENSFSSEDYYGLLDDTEGEWVESSSGSLFETTDIAIGRIPVRTPAEDHGNASDALAVVQKIIDYDATTSFGKWRNYMTLTADDGDYNTFTRESESPFATNITASEPAYNLRKAYLDLFPQVSVAAGQRSPQAVAAIDDALEQGSLLIGYTGHGGPGGLANEQLITKASLLALRNQNRLTFLVTGTCDLSTYDNPDYTSAGEAVLTDNLSAGAVGLFTTTRVVLSTYNTEVVNSFYTQVLTRNAAGNLPTLGFAASVAKNNQPSGDLNNRNYTLLGDPSGQLAYPRQRVVVDSINGHRVQSMTVSRDTLQALRRVRISGHVENRGSLNLNFNGTASITIFDKPIYVKTLGDEILDTTRVRVRTQNTVIYDGQASVHEGRWSTSLVVPKDIAYAVANGKISLYAADYTRKVDAQGYQLVPVGGAARSALADTRPPRISLFMTDEVLAPNDTSFVSGGNVNPSSLLVGHLRDESGINTSNASVGHDLTATLDGDPVKLVVLNSAYTADVNRYTSGKVRYLYKNLATGNHTVTLKAWDTYNNSAESRLDFVVASSEQLALTHVLNYPNPFVGNTTFHFDHNRPGQPLDVQVQIFTIAGRLVKTLRASYANTPGLTPSTAHVPGSASDSQLTWNGLDDYQDKLARGVYVYRISIRTGEQLATKYEKLVLLN